MNNLDSSFVYQDGLNSFPIIDNDITDIQNDITDIQGDVFNLNELIDSQPKPNFALPSLITPTTIIHNKNVGGEIWFETNDTQETQSAGKIRVRITNDGRLLIYHIFNILAPQFTEGWKEIDGTIVDLYAQFNVLNLTTLPIISGTLIAHGKRLDNIETILSGVVLDLIENIENITEEDFLEYTLNLNRKSSWVEIIRNSINDNFTSTGAIIGFGLWGAGIVIGSVIEYFRLNSVKDLINNATFTDSNIQNNKSNFTDPIDARKRYLMEYEQPCGTDFLNQQLNYKKNYENIYQIDGNLNVDGLLSANKYVNIIGLQGNTTTINSSVSSSVAQTQIGTTEYYYCSYTSSGTFTVPANFIGAVDILLVAGGGSGGTSGGGGGGAGAVIYLKQQKLTQGIYNITIGSGGTSTTTPLTTGNKGNDTKISLNGTDIFKALGGGGGVSLNDYSNAIGGSGGGGNIDTPSANVSSIYNIPISSFGNTGGGFLSSINYKIGAGGGGAGSIGGNVMTNIAGSGGAGLSIDITGSSIIYGAGGAGGIDTNPTANLTGGVGGAGGGGSTATNASGYGCGGGGGNYNSITNSSGISGAGSDGIVIIKFMKKTTTSIIHSGDGNALTNLNYSNLTNITYKKPITYTSNTLSIDNVIQNNLTYVFKQNGVVVNPTLYSGNVYQYTFTSSGTINFSANTVITFLYKNTLGNIFATDTFNYTTPNIDLPIQASALYTFQIDTFTISPNSGVFDSTPTITFDSGIQTAVGRVVLNYTGIYYMFIDTVGFFTTKPVAILMVGGGDGIVQPTQPAFEISWNETTIDGTTVYTLKPFRMISFGANYVRTDNITFIFSEGVLHPSSATPTFIVRLLNTTINTIILSNRGIYATTYVGCTISPPPITGQTLITANLSLVVNSISGVIVRFVGGTSQTYKAINDSPINPSFTWSANDSTGIYQPNQNEIGFSINGYPTGLINTLGFKGDGSQLTNISYANITGVPTIPSIANLYSKYGGEIYGNVIISSPYTISGNGSGLTSIVYNNIIGTPIYQNPLSNFNNIVSLNTVPVSKGGTGCTSLSSYFSVVNDALIINSLPYENLNVADGAINYSKLNIADGAIPYAKINIADGAINYSKLNIADGAIPYAKLNGAPNFSINPFQLTAGTLSLKYDPSTLAIDSSLGLKVIGGTGGNLQTPPSIIGASATLISGNTYYVAFTSTSGTNSISFSTDTICDILIVGGGGSGGNIMGGGGGAGGVVYQQNVSLSAGTYTITVGNGGASTGTAGTQSGVQGNNGGHSFIQFSGTDLTKNGITFRGYGGGGGGCYFTPTSSYVATAGNDGGSGGGGGVSNNFSDGTANHAGFGAAAGKKTQGLTFYNTTTNTNVQGGYDAGIGYFVPGSIGFMCPGGGGAGGLGGSAPTNGTGISQGCNGGIGVSCSITGVPVLYAGGGGGCLYSNYTATITGGQGQAGGGNGATNTSGATSATANTGSGGGGGGFANNHTVSGAGGSGVVIIRYTLYNNPTTFESPLSITNNIVSLGTVPVSKGGTGATSLSSYFSVVGGAFSINNLPYENLTIADGNIPYAKLNVADGDIPYVKINIADGAINYSKLTIADGNIPYSKLNIADGDIPYAKLNGKPTFTTNPFQLTNNALALKYDSNTLEVDATTGKLKVVPVNWTTILNKPNIVVVPTPTLPTIVENGITKTWLTEGSSKYYKFTSLTGVNSITCTTNTIIDVYVIGSGGNGGAGAFGGGGGGGEIITKTNYTLYANYPLYITIGNPGEYTTIKTGPNLPDYITEFIAKSGGTGGYIQTTTPSIVGATATLLSGTTYYVAFTTTTGTKSITFSNDYVCDVLIVGGGGAGGATVGGGGGAGAFIYKPLYKFTAGTYNINVGAGGIAPQVQSGGNNSDGGNGEESSIINSSTSAVIFRAIGGGGGRAFNSTLPGKDGASGGGSSCSDTIGLGPNGGSAINTNNVPAGTYGNKGGRGNKIQYNEFTGGGGGGSYIDPSAGEGKDGSTNSSGDGGHGIGSDITGETIYYACGGSGGCTGTTPGLGGTGSGGVGNSDNILPSRHSGDPNTGSGGGGGGPNSYPYCNGGNGGSGIVVFRYTLYTNATTGGSGGGGFGGVNYQTTTTGGTTSISGNPPGSIKTVGTGDAGTTLQGGTGGSITGTFILNDTYGLGGTGATSTSQPTVKTANSGSGGDGNGGLGSVGAVIVRINSGSTTYYAEGGSAGAPNFTWADDATTGMYHPATEQIAFSCGGIQKLLINSSGISGNGSGLTNIAFSNLTGTPTFESPLSITNNIVSLGTVPVSKGGTGATSLSSYFSVVGGAFSINNLPYENLTINDGDIPYAKLNGKPTFTTNPFQLTNNALALKYDSNTLEVDATTGNLKVISTSSQWTTSGTSIYYNNPVGIGTNVADTSYALTVGSGGIKSSGPINILGLSSSINTNFINYYNSTTIYINTPTQFYINNYLYPSPLTIGKATITFGTGTISVDQATTSIISNDRSYLVLKDSSGNVISPSVWYKFDTADGILKDSAGSYDLTAVNGPSSTTSNFIKGDASVVFNGSTQYLTRVSTGIDLDNKSFTIMFWSYRTRTGQYEGLFALGTVNSLRQKIFIYYHQDGTVKMAFISDDITTYETHLETNQWVHWAFTYDFNGASNGWQRIYKNGILIQERNSGKVSIATNTMRLGMNSDGSYPFAGNLDDFRIYERSLTPEQIYEIYRGKISIPQQKIFQHFAGNDTALSPSFTWNENTNTGLYQPNTNEIGISCGGTNVGTFSNSGLTTTDLTAKGNINISGLTSYVSSFNNYFSTTTINITTPTQFYINNILNPILLTPGVVNLYFELYGRISISQGSVYIVVKNKTYPTLTGKTPIAWYKFDDSNNLGLDTIGNYNATQTNCLPSPITAKELYSLDFNTTGYLTLPNNFLNNLSSYTIAFWVYLKTLGASIITSKQGNGDNVYATLSTAAYPASTTGIYTAGTAGRIYYHPKNGTQNAQIQVTLSAGIWYHIGFACSTTQCVVYYNGYANYTYNGDYSLPDQLATITSNCFMGKWIGSDGIQRGSNFNGYIDDFRVYNSFLTDSDMYELYKSKVSIPIQTNLHYGSSDLVSAPSFTWNGNTNTGIYQPATNQVGISCGGTNVLTFSSGGLTTAGNITILGLSSSISNTNFHNYFASTTVYVYSRMQFYINNILITNPLNIGTTTITFGIGTITVDQGAVSIVSNDRSYPILKDSGGNIINPTAWYKFDSVNGILIDSAGTYTLTATGTPSFDINNFVKGDASLALNGTTQYMTAAGKILSNSGTNAFSISCWVRIGDSTNRVIWLLGSSPTINQICQLVYFNNKYIIDYWEGNTFQSATYTGDVNNWVHLVFTVNSTTRSLYRNGVSTPILTGSSTQLNLTSTWTIGKGNGTQSSFSGYIDDFRIYERVLTTTEIAELYTGRVSIPQISNIHYGGVDTVSAPSFTWDRNTNTGIYQPTTNQIGVSCGGTNVTTFSSGGVSISNNMASGSITTGSISASSLSATGAISGSSLSTTGAISGSSLNTTGSIGCSSLSSAYIYSRIAVYSESTSYSDTTISGKSGWFIPTNRWWQGGLGGSSFATLHITIKWTDDVGCCFWSGRVLMGSFTVLGAVNVIQVENLVNQGNGTRNIMNIAQSDAGYDATGTHYLNFKMNNNYTYGTMHYKIFG